MSKTPTDYAVSSGTSWWYLIDFRNLKGYGPYGEERVITDDINAFKKRVLLMDNWIPISEEDFYKVRIGGERYVQEYYHRPHGTHFT